MPSVALKRLPAVLMGVGALASVLVYGRVPAMIELRLEDLFPFERTGPAELMPRWFAFFLVPVLSLVIWVAFRWAPTASGQRVARRMFRHAPEEVTSPGQFERFGRTYDTIVLGVVVLLMGIHGAVLAGALQAPGVASRIAATALGACLLLMGNVMPRLRANWVAGVRTKRTLEDPQVWRSTHRVFGSAIVVSGLITIIVAVVAPRYGLLVGLASLLVSCVIGLAASMRAGSAATHAALVALGLLCAAGGGLAAQARPNGMLLQLQGVNHVLKAIESMDLQARMETCRDPSLPLAAVVVPAIARWIAQRTVP